MANLAPPHQARKRVMDIIYHVGSNDAILAHYYDLLKPGQRITKVDAYFPDHYDAGDVLTLISMHKICNSHFEAVAQHWLGQLGGPPNRFFSNKVPRGNSGNSGSRCHRRP